MSVLGILCEVFAPIAIAVGALTALAALAIGICAPGLIGWAISGSAHTGYLAAVGFWGVATILFLLWIMGWSLMED